MIVPVVVEVLGLVTGRLEKWLKKLGINVLDPASQNGLSPKNNKNHMKSTRYLKKMVELLKKSPVDT